MTGDKDFDELLTRCLEILKTKSIDYAEADDRLAEFRATAKENGLTMKQVFGVYMSKHFRSVQKWARGEELKGESVDHKFMDLIVYSLLGFKLMKEEKGRFCLQIENTSYGKMMISSDVCYHEASDGSDCQLPIHHRGPCGRKRKLKAKWTEEQVKELEATDAITEANRRASDELRNSISGEGLSFFADKQVKTRDYDDYEKTKKYLPRWCEGCGRPLKYNNPSSLCSNCPI